MRHLNEKRYNDTFVSTFEGDPSGDLRSRQTPGVLYARANPTPVGDPALLAWSEDVAGELEIAGPPTPQDIEILAGNRITESMKPYAVCYAGHQFGNWAGQLGDGRAITLGEIVNSKGQSYDLQLKGAGRTPYSRHADGRAVLRSSLREYLMSEAMHYLGVPTTRALSLVLTGDPVLRDMFYDGRPAEEPGAIVARVAPTFIRFGNFEILAARKEIDHLRRLVDWTIATYYPHIQGDDKIIEWFQEVQKRTLHLIIEWTRVGFVHGVMNSDNMSILGLTIDYGPYSFLDEYDPNFTPNTTDLPGRRYAFGNQASIAYWNIGCLASAIAPLFTDIGPLKEAMAAFENQFLEAYFSMMGRKLGLDRVDQEDQRLILRLEQLMTELKPDMTIFYQLLMDLAEPVRNHTDLINHFDEAFYGEPTGAQAEQLRETVNLYLDRLDKNTISRTESREMMASNNPRFILRNYLLHQAIEELNEGKDTLFTELQEAIKKPYDRDRNEKFFVKRPDWAAQKAGCSMLSCSS